MWQSLREPWLLVGMKPHVQLPHPETNILITGVVSVLLSYKA